MITRLLFTVAAASMVAAGVTACAAGAACLAVGYKLGARAVNADLRGEDMGAWFDRVTNIFGDDEDDEPSPVAAMYDPVAADIAHSADLADSLPVLTYADFIRATGGTL